MRKSTRIVKRLLALFLVVLMSIESFGAVVGDNDGSAFITKAEFDSLKNNFQSQIDQYNTSIDSKIDGSIAAYLAGITVAVKSVTNLTSTLKDVPFGDGYRAHRAAEWDVDTGDIAEWIMNSSMLTVSNGSWRDMDQGLIASYRVAEGWDGALANFNGKIWYNKYESSGTVSWLYEEMNAVRIQASIAMNTHKGVLEPTRPYRPWLFADKNGLITDNDTTRITIIDNRIWKGVTWPTGAFRFVSLIGLPGVNPSYAVYNFNEDVVPDGYAACYSSTAVTDASWVKTTFPIRALVKAPTKTYNKNVFCWDLTSTTSWPVFLSDKEKWYVNGAVTNPAISNYGSKVAVKWLCRAEQFAGQALNIYMSRPALKFQQLSDASNLPASCFATVTNDSQKECYAQYLRNADFVGSDKSTHPYIYQGLPVYYAEKNGTLEFKIKIKTNYDFSAYFFTDPGTASSKVKLRIKSSEFNIGNDTSGSVSMKVGTSSSPITSGTTAVTEASLTPGELTTIQIENCERGKTYFLRWYVDGFQYGGEITYLGDGYFTET
ncbi:MAG: hypothetical protein J6P02_00010 [Lachnospiraceae bacterium]|nr:hypothetical protein [Lachnospiraceae bacterium]